MVLNLHFSSIGLTDFGYLKIQEALFSFIHTYVVYICINAFCIYGLLLRLRDEQHISSDPFHFFILSSFILMLFSCKIVTNNNLTIQGIHSFGWSVIVVNVNVKLKYSKCKQSKDIIKKGNSLRVSVYLPLPSLVWVTFSFVAYKSKIISKE